MKKRRRLPGPRWNEYASRNERRMPPARNVRNRSFIGPDGAASCVIWREREPGDRRSITASAELWELVPIRSPTLWGGANNEWSKEGKHHQSPVWAGDLWSASPMHHQQLAAKMVCSWKLIKAYQRTRQSTYICPPAPHVIEAFNQGESRHPQRAGCSGVRGPSIRSRVAVCIVLQ